MTVPSSFQGDLQALAGRRGPRKQQLSGAQNLLTLQEEPYYFLGPVLLFI